MLDSGVAELRTAPTLWLLTTPQEDKHANVGDNSSVPEGAGQPGLWGFREGPPGDAMPELSLNKQLIAELGKGHPSEQEAPSRGVGGPREERKHAACISSILRPKACRAQGTPGPGHPFGVLSVLSPL